MKKIVLGISLLFCLFSLAQSSYTTIVIPKIFKFQKSENEYNLNMMMKTFFEKEGFVVYYDDKNLPQEIANNRCNVLFADVLDNSGMLKTKFNVEIKDCQGNVLHTSFTGESKEKEYAKAYNAALRFALSSMTGELAKFKKKDNKVESKPSVSNDFKSNSENETSLFALPIANGYKLVDASPKTIFELFKTSDKNIFIAKKKTLQGVFFQKENQWFFEYYQNDKLISEKIEVKF